MAKIQPKRTLGVEEQEKALRNLYKEDSEKEKEKSTVRVTIDFTQAMHEQIKGEISYNGQTIKGFVTTLIRDYFEKKGNA
jgi:hypothetical protein